MTKPTNFDRYLEDQLKDPAFAERLKEAGEAWDVALQIAALRKKRVCLKRARQASGDLSTADKPPGVSGL